MQPKGNSASMTGFGKTAQSQADSHSVPQENLRQPGIITMRASPSSQVQGSGVQRGSDYQRRKFPRPNYREKQHHYQGGEHRMTYVPKGVSQGETPSASATTSSAIMQSSSYQPLRRTGKLNCSRINPLNSLFFCSNYSSPWSS